MRDEPITHTIDRNESRRLRDDRTDRTVLIGDREYDEADVPDEEGR